MAYPFYYFICFHNREDFTFFLHICYIYDLKSLIESPPIICVPLTTYFLIIHNDFL